MHFDDSKSSIHNSLYVAEYQRFIDENGQVPGMVVARGGSDCSTGLPEGKALILLKSFRIKRFRKIVRFRRLRRLASAAEILSELSGGRAEFEPKAATLQGDSPTPQGSSPCAAPGSNSPGP